MSFLFWFPVGVLAGLAIGVVALVYDFMGLRSTLEDDIREGMEEIDVWDVFATHGRESRDSCRFEDLMRRTQMWIALACVLMGVLALVGPW